MIAANLAAHDNRATVDDDGASFCHVTKDGEDLGDVVGPSDSPHSWIHRQLIDDVAWRGSIDLLGSLKDCGLAGLIGKRATEDQHSILDACMKIGWGEGGRCCRWGKVPWKAESSQEAKCNNTSGKNRCTLHGSPHGRTGDCTPQ